MIRGTLSDSQCSAESNPYSMLYNDDINKPSIAHAFALPEAEAVEYCPYGCGEYVIEHKSFGTPSGVINLPSPARHIEQGH